MDAAAPPILSPWAGNGQAGAAATLPEGPRVDGLAATPAEALERAHRAFPGRDVLLMRADVVLPPAGLERLLAAWRTGEARVLSPLDRRWPLPAGLDDAAAWRHAAHAAFPWAGWSPLCSLWRGEAIGQASPDAIAAQAGALLPALLVEGEVTPAWEPVPPPVQALLSRWRDGGDVRPDRPVLLHVLHAWGGGAERFVRDLMAADRARRHLVLVARGDHDRPPFGRRLCLHEDLDAAPLRTWPLASPIADTVRQSPEVQAVLRELCEAWGIGAVLVSSLIGHSLDVLRTGLPTAWCAHDAYPFWPLLHDLRDPAHEPFDLARLAGQLGREGAGVFATDDAATWWALREATVQSLASADAVMVAPSAFARRRMETLVPALAARRWRTIGHGQGPLPAAPRPARSVDAPLRVLVPGRLHGDKGERLLEALLPRLPAGVELVLLGGGPVANRFAGMAHVHVMHDYAHAELAAHVQALAPDLALLPSTVPETWGYVLSEMLALGLPVLCSREGALGERVASCGRAWCLAPDADAFASALAMLVDDRARLDALREAPAPVLPTPEQMAANWREALPSTVPGLQLRPATPAETALDTAAVAIDDFERVLAEAGQLARDQQQELDRRADWAQDLEQSLARARAEIQALEGRHDGQDAQHAAGLAAQDARIAELAQERADAQARAAGLAHSLAGAEARVAELAQSLADAEARVSGLAQDLARKRRDLQASEAARDAALRAQETATRDMEQLRAQLSAGDERLAHQACALADASERLAALERELEARRERLARLEALVQQQEEHLAEAHGYYQRDCADLARQRDVALAQRDEAQAMVRRMERSLSWRLTAWPRTLARPLRRRWAALRYHVAHARTLVGRGLESLRSRGLVATWQRVLARRATPAPAAVAAPETDSGRTTGGALRLPRPEGVPRASVIVPVYNQLATSLACLRALADCGDATGFEVIVVDDASTDDTARVLPSVPGLRYHRNERNLGFIGACNAGAARARGDYLVFLNNDTTVQPGWLDALLATFDRYPDTGLAGSKLVYPDGRLQEAGGIVFADGSGWNYGRFEDPAHPRYNHVREVDYCSGAAIALPRPLFQRLGGFDAHYAPAYYEDTDLAMRVRQLGMKVRYQPASVVVHHEGVSSGTDITTGVKAWQAVNHGKFLERWREVLAREHPAPGTPAHRAARHRDPHRVLVLDACTPTPDRDSGSVRMAALLRLLREEGCSVAFFPENRMHDAAYTEALQQAGIECWWYPWLHDVPGWIEAEGAGFDLVIGSRHYVLSPLLPLLRTHAPRAHVVFDTVDLHHLREQREAELSGDPAKQRAADRTRRIELALIEATDTTWVVSAAEQALLAAEAPEARVQVVSNIHEAAAGAGPPWSAREGLLFVGSYRHPPNVDAATWLVREILPRVRAQAPEIFLHLVGGDAPPEVEALGREPGVVFHGYVPDLGPRLAGARIAVAPLRYGAGVKGKVNQALAQGLPVVATGCAVEGMHLRDGEDALVADDTEAFARAVLRLYGDEALWARLSQGGLENTRRHFSPEVVRQPLRELLASLRPR